MASSYANECPICTHNYEPDGDHAPFSLPCMHSVCQSCVNECTSKKLQMVCGTCAAKCDTSAAKKNFALIDYMNKENPTGKRMIGCGGCKRNDIVDRCMVCTTCAQAGNVDPLKDTESAVLVYVFCGYCAISEHQNHGHKIQSFITDKSRLARDGADIRAKQKEMKTMFGLGQRAWREAEYSVDCFDTVSSVVAKYVMAAKESAVAELLLTEFQKNHDAAYKTIDDELLPVFRTATEKLKTSVDNMVKMLPPGAVKLPKKDVILAEYGVEMSDDEKEDEPEDSLVDADGHLNQEKMNKCKKPLKEAAEDISKSYNELKDSCKVQ